MNCCQVLHLYGTTGGMNCITCRGNLHLHLACLFLLLWLPCLFLLRHCCSGWVCTEQGSSTASCKTPGLVIQSQ